MKEPIEWINSPASEQFKIAETTVATYHFKHKIFANYFQELLNEIKTARKMIETYLDASQ